MRHETFVDFRLIRTLTTRLCGVPESGLVSLKGKRLSSVASPESSECERNLNGFLVYGLGGIAVSHPPASLACSNTTVHDEEQEQSRTEQRTLGTEQNRTLGMTSLVCPLKARKNKFRALVQPYKSSQE